MTRIGELFAGYGGLGMGVKAAVGGDVAWVSDIDPGANKVLAHRFPDVPNIGDITTVDWSQVEPVDVLTGGFPCQDVSAAGKRAGIRPGTRSGLWAQFAYAIDRLRPSLVVIENVRGLLSASAHSDVEPCPWCLGDRPDGHMRALGAVLGDLARLGYDAAWHGLRAADVGAPHGRFRVFIVAYPNGEGRRSERWLNAVGRDADGRSRQDGLRSFAEPTSLLPSPRTSDTNGAGLHGDGGMDLRTAVSLMPTPRAGDGTKGGPNQRGSSGDPMLPSAVQTLPTPQARDWKGYGPADGHRHDPNLSAIPLLLPTPMVGSTSPAAHGQVSGQWREQMAAALSNWGQYADAIARWEQRTRPAPAPTELSTKGTPRLSARFSEWLMGLTDGWVTDVPGITRNEALKACGNGVVPQQAEAALRVLMPHVSGAAA